MQKKLVAVGMTLPGELVEQVSITSERSLLDADIVLVKPNIPYDYYRNFQGKPWLEDTSAFRARESIAHWRREIEAAFYAGKVIIIFLCKPYEVFVDTGGQRVSGPG